MKRLLIIIGFISLFNWIFTHGVSGQTTIQQYKKTAPLEDSTYLKRTDLFLLTQFDSIQETLNIYVMNSTDSTVLLSTYNHGRGPFKMRIKDTRQYWKDMSTYWPCYPRPKNKSCASNGEIKGVKIAIPPNSYIWKSYSFKNREEDFKTKIQPFVSINNQLITTAPIEVVLDRSKALTEKEMILRNIDELLLEKEIGPETLKDLMLDRVIALNGINDRRKEAFELINKLLKKYPKSNKAIYLKGKILAGIPFKKKVSKAYRIMRLNAALTEFEKVVFGYEMHYYDEAKRYAKRFKENFPTRAEWDLINDLECKEIDGKYYCYEKQFLKDWVLIRFSDE